MSLESARAVPALSLAWTCTFTASNALDATEDSGIVTLNCPQSVALCYTDCDGGLAARVSCQLCLASASLAPCSHEVIMIEERNCHYHRAMVTAAIVSSWEQQLLQQLPNHHPVTQQGCWKEPKLWIGPEPGVLPHKNDFDFAESQVLPVAASSPTVHTRLCSVNKCSYSSGRTDSPPLTLHVLSTQPSRETKAALESPLEARRAGAHSHAYWLVGPLPTLVLASRCSDAHNFLPSVLERTCPVASLSYESIQSRLFRAEQRL